VRYVGVALASLFLLCVEVDAYGHGRTVRLSQLDHPYEHRIVRAQVPDSLQCSSQGVLLGCLVEPASSAFGLVSISVRNLQKISSCDIFDV
jgi:hypothetical protein